MSKSLPPAGCVFLLDDPRSREEDPFRGHRHRARGGRRRRSKPGVTNLLTIHSALSGQLAALEDQFAGRGYGDLKKELAEVVTDFVTPVRARTQELLDDPPSCSGSSRGCGPCPRGRRCHGGQVYERVGFLSPAAGPEIRGSNERRHVRAAEHPPPRRARCSASSSGAGALGPAAGRLADEVRRPAGQPGAAARDAAAAHRGGRPRPPGDQRAPCRRRALPPAVRDAPVRDRHLLPGLRRRLHRGRRGVGNCELIATDVAGARWPGRWPSRTTRT